MRVFGVSYSLLNLLQLDHDLKIFDRSLLAADATFTLIASSTTFVQCITSGDWPITVRFSWTLARRVLWENRLE